MEMQKLVEVKMFGETVEEMRTAARFYLDSPVALNSYAGMVLADAKVFMLSGQADIAIQLVNKAQYFIEESLTLVRYSFQKKEEK